MALSRQAKEAALAEISELLKTTKMLVVAKYTGTTVKEAQELRQAAADNSTVLKVTKNRLVILAMKANEDLKDADTSVLEGQLMYAFNAEDEVAPAQVLHNFAKQHPQIEFVGAYSEDGTFMDAEQVKQLAQLPSKEQLRGQLVGTVAAPLSGLVNVLGGNVRGLVNVLNARVQEMEG